MELAHADLPGELMHGQPQINGVVMTLRSTVRWLERWGHEVRRVISTEGFRTFPLPDLSRDPARLLPAREVARGIREFDPDAMHIATEAPLGRGRAPPLPKHGTRRSPPPTTPAFPST